MFNIPINIKPYYNTDQVANSIAADDMFDCYLEPVPEIGFVTRRRPGLKNFTDLGTGAAGDGLYYWEAANKVIAVSGGKTFEVKSDGTTTDLTGAALNVGTPVVFSDGINHDGTPWLYLANGKLVYLDNTHTTTTAPTDVDTPAATHVAWINEKFVANKPGTAEFLTTDVNDATGFFDNGFWSGANNPITCDARGDNLVALTTAWQEVYAWGSASLQVFQDDGVTPFVNIAGAFAEIGLEAPYSIVRSDNTMFALCVVDGKRVVVKFQGRAPVVVSEPIGRVLAELTTVSDAVGDVVSVGGLAIYLLQFPTAGETWAYDFKNDVWCRWGYFVDGEHQAFLGQHSCFVKPWNKHLIMSRVDGKIYELDRNTYDDAGNPMVSFRRTGWIDHNNAWKRKRSNQFYIKVKSREKIEGETISLLLRWRNDGNPVFSNYMALPLNPDYQEDSLIKLNRFGMYRSRQYEFRISDSVDLVLVGATEDVTEMRN